jgi:hypothetical protein
MIPAAHTHLALRVLLMIHKDARHEFSARRQSCGAEKQQVGGFPGRERGFVGRASETSQGPKFIRKVLRALM